MRTYTYLDVHRSIPTPFPLGRTPFYKIGIRFFECELLGKLLDHLPQLGHRSPFDTLIPHDPLWGFLEEIHTKVLTFVREGT